MTNVTAAKWGKIHSLHVTVGELWWLICTWNCDKGKDTVGSLIAGPNGHSINKHRRDDDDDDDDEIEEVKEKWKKWFTIRWHKQKFFLLNDWLIDNHDDNDDDDDDEEEEEEDEDDIRAGND